MTLGQNWRAGGGPFGGREWRAGDRAWPGAMIGELPELASPYVLAKIDEIDRGRLRQGMDATVVVEALPGAELPAKLSAFSTLAKPDYTSWPPPRMFDATIDLDKPDTRLRPGHDGLDPRPGRTPVADAARAQPRGDATGRRPLRLRAGPGAASSNGRSWSRGASQIRSPSRKACRRRARGAREPRAGRRTASERGTPAIMKRLVFVAIGLFVLAGVVTGTRAALAQLQPQGAGVPTADGQARPGRHERARHRRAQGHAIRDAVGAGLRDPAPPPHARADRRAGEEGRRRRRVRSLGPGVSGRGAASRSCARPSSRSRSCRPRTRRRKHKTMWTC